jgi:hypothetical protein
MDTPWREAGDEILRHLILDNHTKFGWDIPSSCGVLEAGIKGGTILMTSNKEL